MVVNLQSGHEIALQYNQREITVKNIESRVMVIVHDTSSYCALQLHEVSFL